MVTTVIEGHDYQVIVFEKGKTGYASPVIKFQNGPVKEVGVNGIQNIDLIDILIDRMIYLQTFENGKYASFDNDCMLTRLREFRTLDLARTSARKKRDVEGTSKV